MKYFFAPLLLLTACTGHDKKIKHFKGIEIETEKAVVLPMISNNPLVLNVPKKDSTLLIDSLIQNVRYLPLETKDSSLIGNVRNIFFFENNIVVVDNEIANSVFVFDTAGKFIFKINDKNYSTISNVSINKSSKTIIILDNKISKLFYYNFNGELVKTIRLGVRFIDFAPLGKDTMALFVGKSKNDHAPLIDYYSLLVMNESKEITYKDYPIPLKSENFKAFGKHHITICDSNTYFFPRFSDTVFKLLPNGYKSPQFVFKTANPIPKELYNNNNLSTLSFTKKIIEGDYNYFQGSFYENSTHGITTLQHTGGLPTLNIICFDKQSAHVLNIAGINKKFGGTLPYADFAFPIAIYKNQFVGVLFPEYLVQFKQQIEQSKSKLSNELSKLFSLIKKDSNPILMMYSLKDF